MNYAEFLEGKRISSLSSGIPSSAEEMGPHLFPFQAAICAWALSKGRAAIFADTGLGKSRMQLTWASRVSAHTGKQVLILAPLAVAEQTAREGDRIGVPVTVCRSGEDLRAGVNITNYERLHLFEGVELGGVVLDESSILKAFSGATRKQISAFSAPIPFRLACTATPAPNDTVEIINHAEFLGVMQGKEMIALFFTQDGNTTHAWRLKGHAKRDFWAWLSSWAVAVRRPSDLGFSDDGYELPPVEMHHHVMEVDTDEARRGMLIPMEAEGIAEQRKARKATMRERVSACAELVNGSPEQWIVWCDLNDESGALNKAIPDAVEVKGSDTPEHKAKALLDFADGRIRVLVTKPSIAGLGLNFQGCAHMAFCGIGNSYESFYQAVRRCHRFGQTRQVQVHVIASSADGAILRNLDRKDSQARELMDELIAHGLSSSTPTERNEMDYQHNEASGRSWRMLMGDSCQRIDEIETESVGLTIFSPPFPGMYAYTSSARDVGNSNGLDELMDHFSFLVEKLFRVMKAGRCVAVHLTQMPSFISSGGDGGLEDFHGATIQAFRSCGFAYRATVTIDKDPQLKAARTKEQGLLFKTLSSDSSLTRPAMADYLVIFRKPGVNQEPIKAGVSEKYGSRGWITNDEWIEWAHPVWHRQRPGIPGGIRETDVLNVAQARDTDDERHLCLARGSLVLTRDGYIPIEEVQIGAMTLTHEGRWRRVLDKKCNGIRPVIRTTAQGVADLRTTPDHKLWARKGAGPDAKRQALRAAPGWLPAEESLGSYLNMKLPPIEDSPLTADQWWIVGRWLADGHRGTKREGHGDAACVISCGRAKAADMMPKLGIYAGHASEARTAIQVALRDLPPEMIAIIDRCGKGASGKRLPAEAITLCQEKAEALLSGYLSGDGHYVERYDRWTASSVSRPLLLGMALVAYRARGVVASVYAGREPGTAVIEGRRVNTKQDWIFCFRNSHGYRPSGWIADDGAWKKVRSIDAIGEEEVWDLKVEEDSSFTAEGCIVHNCPLQLGVVERAVKLWSNPGDVVFSPFGGIGSEGYRAIQLGRKYVGIELKESYWRSACRNLQQAELESCQPTLFDAVVGGA